MICNYSFALLNGFGFLRENVLGSLAFPELCSTFSLDISVANDSIILVILSNLGSEDEEKEEASLLYLLLST